MRFFSFFDRTCFSSATRTNNTPIVPECDTPESSRSKAISRDEENNSGIFDREVRSPGCLDEESLAVDDHAGGGNRASAVKESASASGANKGDDVDESITKEERAPVATLEVDGMTCAVCVGIVENLLKR